MTTTTHAPRRTLGFTALLGSLVVAAFALLGPASPAQAHDQLLDSQVVAGADGKPTAIRLSYSGNILGVGNEVRVTDSKGRSVAKGEPTALNRDLTQNLIVPLADGEYTGLWHVVSSDGHAIEGAFKFTVVNGAAGAITATEIPGSGSGSTTAPAPDADSGSDSDAGSGMSPARILAIIGVLIVVGAVVVPFFKRKNREL